MIGDAASGLGVSEIIHRKVSLGGASALNLGQWVTRGTQALHSRLGVRGGRADLLNSKVEGGGRAEDDLADGLVEATAAH